MFSCAVTGVGAYVPERRMTNRDLEDLVDTSDEWIVQRTGIRERRIVAPDQATSDLAVEAARNALADAGEDAASIDCIILATCTPDTILPAGAVYVQRALAARSAAAFDVSAACTGFVYGMTIGSSLIASGVHQKVIVIGAEALSRIVDFEDRNTCILFGDGAGAVVLARTDDDSPSRFVDSRLYSDGEGKCLIEQPAGGSRLPATHETIDARQHFVKMQGREVFKFATRVIVELIETALERNGLSPADLKLVVPHQVNFRIIEAALKKIDLPPERLYINLERYGNTSAASVPLGLSEAVAERRVERGDWVLLLAFGAGMTWGYNLLRW